MDRGDAEQHSAPSNYAGGKDTFTIRSFQRSDQKQCQQIFRDGFQEFVSTVCTAILSSSLWYVGMATVFAAVIWSASIFVVFILVTFIVLAFLCAILQIVGRQRVNSAITKRDLKDIEKSYMSDEGCHMWVAEWGNKVVGMVGLVHDERHEPGVFELQRIYVVPYCRQMGIGKRMLIELITHAKKHGIKTIILSTTITQKAAIQLYMKFGFNARALRSSTKESDQFSTSSWSIYRAVAVLASFLTKYFKQLELSTSSAKTL